MLYWSEHTEDRLNNLSETEEIKENEQTGCLRKCDLGHGRPIEHGYLLSEANLDYSDLKFSERKYTFSYNALTWFSPKIPLVLP